MRKVTQQDSGRASRDDVRAAAKKALMQLLVPLAGFVSDSGLSAGELHSIFREAAVRSAAAKQLEASSRVNISGIAATTGISRSDISKILKVKAAIVKNLPDVQQQSTNRILAAWHEDPKFTGSNGKPLDLSIYGRGLTFEALTKKYGRGIPTRAVLDELVRAGAIEVLASQKIRAKATMSIDRGMSARVINAFGERASELLSTMLLNMRQPDSPKFIASVSDAGVLPASLPLLRKEMSVRGADFLAEVKEILSRRPSAQSSRLPKRKCGHVSVTVYYHEDFKNSDIKTVAVTKRRNFRRVR